MVIDRVHIYENVLTQDQCEEIIEKSTFSIESKAESGHVYDMDTYIGKQEDEPWATLEKVFDEFSEKYGADIPRLWINVMRYTAGVGMISRHQDTHGPNKDKIKKSYSVLIYLNDIEDGGETVFFENNKEVLVVRPKAGRAIVIPGDVIHEARTPISSNKYIAITRHVEANNMQYSY